jgi:hypothetical protein
MCNSETKLVGISKELASQLPFPSYELVSIGFESYAPEKHEERLRTWGLICLTWKQSASKILRVDSRYFLGNSMTVQRRRA